MSDQRDGGIAWTEQTWNPVRGCSRVSAGCENCYAEQVARRFSGPGEPYEGLVRIGKNGLRKAQWNGRVKFIAEHLLDPLSWTRPRLVFVNSMSDLFHEDLPFHRIAAIFGVMASAPRHTFQVLTKRPERALEFFRWAAERDAGLSGTPGLLHCVSEALAEEVALGKGEALHRKHCADPSGPWPLPNVWLGVSVEDQRSANERIPRLLKCPAAVRWVSYEPALGPIDFTDIVSRVSNGVEDHIDALRYEGNAADEDDEFNGATIDWVVVGGESGTGARPFDLAWARSVIAQCAAASVPCFVKQLGALPIADSRNVAGLLISQLDPSDRGLGNDHVAVKLKDRKGGDEAEWPLDLRVRQWPQRGAQ